MISDVSAYARAGAATAGIAGIMAAAVAQEDLDDLVDEQQGDGSDDAYQPLVPAQ